MTPLRLEMISSLELKNYATNTIKNYVAHVSRYALYFKTCPSKLGPKEVNIYLHHILNKNYSFSHYRQIISALRYLYREVLHYDWMIPHIPFPRKSRRKIHQILTPEEIGRVLESCEQLRDRAIIATLYGTGLRLFELRALQPTDIDSEHMLVHVRKGKWDKARHTVLPKSLLLLLREYYRESRPKQYLFEGRKGPISESAVQRLCKKAGKQAELNIVLTPRTLRHAFATHLYEAKENLLTIQALLGHAHVATTQFYIHVNAEHLRNTPSPLDRLLQ